MTSCSIQATEGIYMPWYDIYCIRFLSCKVKNTSFNPLPEAAVVTKILRIFKSHNKIAVLAVKATTHETQGVWIGIGQSFFWSVFKTFWSLWKLQGMCFLQQGKKEKVTHRYLNSQCGTF